MKYNFYLLFLGLSAGLGGVGRAARAQQVPAPAVLPSGLSTTHTLEFIPNKGQWPDAVRYSGAVPGGHLYLEPSGLHYVLLEPIRHPHHPPGGSRSGQGKTAHAEPGLPAADSLLRGHQLRVRFVGADQATPLVPAQATGEVRNYLQGNDPAAWASGVPSYRQVRYQAPWPGIGARFYENQKQQLEYDFELAAGADPALVKLKYDGASALTLGGDGRLHVGTTVGELTELAPQAYQTDPVTGARQPVACRYRLRAADSTVTFALGRYDHHRSLVIDPTVQFSTYSGASGDNWGFTATYDAAGNMYSGGIVLNNGSRTPSYPTTTGAFQTTFGGVVDIAVIKYNTAANGAASRVWATYIGGSSHDFPSSLVVNNANELIVLGTTASANYPTTTTAYQRVFKGGTAADPFGYAYSNSAYDVSRGTDIAITRLSSTGGSLAASTYVGGTGTDGLVPFSNGTYARQLPQNYGDAFRSDVLTDAAGNIYVASVTNSTNFPVTTGSFGTTNKGGTSDAVVFKMPADLNALTWSGYLGGSLADAAYSVQLDASNNVYVAGGTLSTNFPVTAGSVLTTAPADVNGFVARIAANGSTVQKATYLGTSSYDQAYFLQLGGDGGVYVLGQTRGIWPVTAGTYNNAGSTQFIQKLSPDLDQRLLSTVFGSGRATLDISPTAFLVDQCDRVYVCGWGGMVNQDIYYSSAYNFNGYTHGMPVTANAVRTTTDTPSAGSDFYLAQFSPGLTSLLYGTFYGDAGANTEGDHVDGGTSRFDPRGVAYAAVCSCFDTNGFPVPPGANTYSPTNGTFGNNCNNAAFKLNFEPTAAAVGLNQTVCANAAAIALTGTPAGGVWTGPGVSGSVAAGYKFTPSPALLGAQTLTYTVTGATAICVSTGYQVITVVPGPAVSLAAPPQDVYCIQAGATPPVITLQGSPAGGTYSGPGVVGNTFAPALAGNGVHTLSYTVGANTPCPATATVQVAVITSTAGADFSVCSNNGPLPLPNGRPAGGVWSGPGVSGSAASGFIFTPDPNLTVTTRQILTYSVNSPTVNCTATATVTALVVVPPVATATPLADVCANNGPVALTNGSPAGGVWTGAGVSVTGGNYFFTPTSALVGSQTLTYTVTSSQVCANITSVVRVNIQVQPVLTILLPADTVLCPGNTQAFRLRATPSGGVWRGPGIGAGNFFTPSLGTTVLTYSVGLGTPCPMTSTYRITLLAAPVLAPVLVPGACTPSNVAPLTVQYRQSAATLPADAVLTWNFGDDSTTVTGFDVTHTYLKGGTFRPRVTVRFNQTRCTQQAYLPVVEVKSMFVPNIITPNGDQLNDLFAPRIGGCPPRLQVFSRWGGKVYEDNAYQNNWGGADLAAGLYYYLITPPDGGAVVKGWIELVK